MNVPPYLLLESGFFLKLFFFFNPGGMSVFLIKSALSFSARSYMVENDSPHIAYEHA
jgi:hypothetical protein